MQEKVSETHKEHVKMFENKTSPNAWVKENVIQYYQVQSQIVLLKDVLTYVKELQEQKLLQLRPPIPLEEAFIPVPERGLPADIGNNAAFNAMQGYLKTTIQFTEELIQTVKAGDPKLNKMSDFLLDQLHQIAKSFPNLSGEQLQNLTGIMDQLLKHVNQLPYSSQRLFWDQMLTLVREWIQENKGNIRGFQGEVKELNARSQMLMEVEEHLQNIQDTLKAQPPSKEQFLQMIQNLQSLANKNPLMNPAQSQALVSFFEKLEGFKSTKGISLSNLVADALVQTKLSSFLATNPRATPEQIKSYLQNFLKRATSLPLRFPLCQQWGRLLKIFLKKNSPVPSAIQGFPLPPSRRGK